MGNQVEIDAVLVVKDILNKFYCESDIKGMLYHLSPKIIWIGPGEDEELLNYKDLKARYGQSKESLPYCSIWKQDIKVIYETNCLCSLAGTFTLKSKEENGILLEHELRFCMLLEWENERFQGILVHISESRWNTVTDKYTQSENDEVNYKNLQRLLLEKTEVINMINSNIMGGLKGSNDDENFSYFYVNEGLPRMLGYTYEEFMEKTGGTAVGAVYPPDLPRALKMVAECFAVGITYTAEYRMEKKDGTLIWVIDTGRKVIDGNGETKINSIISDITPLKDASAQLELERERYHVALDSITDVLCEYDIREDIFVQFQKVKLHEKTELDRIELPSFSKVVVEHGMMKEEELNQVMEVLCGKRPQGMELHTRYIHSNSGWRLSRLRCSVLYDDNGNPVKTLGVIKDITDEKEKEIQLIHKAQRDGLTNLLNQEAVRNEVESYLEETYGREKRGAVLVLDLDHFKPVNDKRGHLFGNHILEEVAEILKESIQKDDISGRIGGDEFLLLLKEDRQRSIQTAENIIQKISQMAMQEEVETTCSIGITMIGKKDRNYDDVFKRADDALYRGKKNGGEQWVEIDDIS